MIKYLSVNKYYLIWSLLSFAAPSVSQAQWTSIAPNLIGRGPYGNLGSMCASHDVAWAGMYELYNSTDRGLTWHSVATPKPLGSEINQIVFYDADTGFFVCDAGLFMTYDQGKSWRTFFPGEFIFAGAFSGSSRAFVAGSSTTHQAYFTQDGGATWNKRATNLSFKDFYSISPGNIIAFTESAANSYVAATTDYGASWTTRKGTMEADAHSWGVVPCDGNLIYGINEEGGNYGQDNNLAEIYRSTDGGNSFKSIQQYPIASLAGCILITPGMTYVPTRTSGILETTDSGTTWVTAPGPTFAIDCRDLVAIDDTILLAADQNGTIWRTIDPRGASTLPTSGVLTFSTNSIQFPDSVSPCAPPAIQTIFVNRGCMSPTINQLSFFGSADSNYFATQTLSLQDSIEILFSPDAMRVYQTNVRLTLSDGTDITVNLSGVGKRLEQITLASQDTIVNDTIGANVDLPIAAQPGIAWGDLDLSLHFDTSMLVYRGSYLPGDGTDHTTQRGDGFARLHFDQSAVQGDSIIAYARFQLFQTNTPCTNVLFDSIRITNPKGYTCALAEPSFSATICSPPECGSHILSNFVRYGVTPSLRIVPNPASGFAAVHSTANMGLAKLSVFDETGTLRKTLDATINIEHPAELDLSNLPAGFYTIRVQSSQWCSFLKLMLVQ
ncbi:MAG TPA: T9SS type A sorting domain-containing protein [Candidatus Kapabacteria bacterium]|nr:T9SS type A sorting domain-containing protein [Candidatus Kapabacteria bacterium]